ncbi:uncharacterized protein LOC119836440 [Zerene cesonia]|uniref:uncharacterized protein LOC119836440 n=1 Tax=Zerene cesonia TaxID=33412 RepID=UPI0018E57553|nr:uncharacterized protein LOC119836440 [Zerene cesonia]
MANTGNTSAVFFLGSRAHYQVLDQPETYDQDSGNTSTETLYQNASVEELWKEVDCDSPNCNERALWNYEPDVNVNFEADTGIKKRINRQSSNALLCDNMQPAALNEVRDSDTDKHKPRRTFLSFLTSLTRRKRRVDNAQYLKRMENVLTTCTYRESCRCLDCQSRYFEYESDTEDYNSEEDYTYNYNVNDVEAQAMDNDESDDEVFVPYNPGDNTSTDLLLDDTETVTSVSSASETEQPVEKQIQLEVAASTSAVLNVLLFHPGCIVQ